MLVVIYGKAVDDKEIGIYIDGVFFGGGLGVPGHLQSFFFVLDELKAGGCKIVQ